MYIAKPTKQQLAWQDMELGVIIHYCMEITEQAGDAAIRDICIY